MRLNIFRKKKTPHHFTMLSRKGYVDVVHHRIGQLVFSNWRTCQNSSYLLMHTSILIQKLGANMVKHVQKDLLSHKNRRRRPYSSESVRSVQNKKSSSTTSPTTSVFSFISSVVRRSECQTDITSPIN